MTRTRIAGVVLALAAAACGAETEELTIEGHRQPCTGQAITSCMVVDGGNFYDGIDGFAFEWGVRQRVIVEVSEIDNPPADGSSVEYELVEIVERVELDAGAELEILLRTGYAEPDTGGFALVGGRRFECDDPQLCADIGARLESEQSFTVTLAHPSDPLDASLPLAAVAVSD